MGTHEYKLMNTWIGMNTHEHKSIQLNTNANNWIQVNRNMDDDNYKWIQIDTHGNRITHEYNWIQIDSMNTYQNKRIQKE